MAEVKSAAEQNYPTIQLPDNNFPQLKKLKHGKRKKVHAILQKHEPPEDAKNGEPYYKRNGMSNYKVMGVGMSADEPEPQDNDSEEILENSKKK